MDWILIGKIFLFWFIPGAILFKFCIWRHFQESDKLTFVDFIIYLFHSIIPIYNIGLIVVGIIIAVVPVIYNKLNGFVIYKKK